MVKQKLIILFTGFLLLSVVLESFRGFVNCNKASIEYSQENDCEEKDSKFEGNEFVDVKSKPVQHGFEILYSSAQKNKYASICISFHCSHDISMPEVPPDCC